MLLQQLLAALAKRRHGRPQAPREASRPASHTGTIAYPGGHLVKDRSLAEIYGGDDDAALDAFMALPVADQMASIEAELAKLPDHEKRIIVEVLGKELGRKWIPLPGPQSMAVSSPADVTLFGGSGGGGKSDTLLGLALTEHKRSLVMRRQYTDLSFLTERAVEINGTRAGFNGTSPPTLTTTDGRLIEFGAAQHAGDEQRWQGRPHDALFIDEAAQFLESQVRYLMGWVRSTDPKQRTRVVLATNPPLSDEGQWLIGMFRPWLDPQYQAKAKPGELRWYVTDEDGLDKEVEGPGPHLVAGKPVRALSRTFIPARLADNPYLARTDYAAKLDALQEPLRSLIRDGNFMAARDDNTWQVIPGDWIRLAQARWTPTPPQVQMTCIAADAAGGGADAAVIAVRYGSWFGPLSSEKGPQTLDGRYLGARILMERRNNCQVVVDVGGGYGGDTVNVLKDNEAPVIGFKGSDAASGVSIGSRMEFANKRAETWWRFREALDPAPSNPVRIALPPDPELAADLATPRLDPRAMQIRGVIQVESKEEIRKRLGRSPDKGDAVTMCFGFGGLLELERKKVTTQKAFANVAYSAAKRRAHR